MNSGDQTLRAFISEVRTSNDSTFLSPDLENKPSVFLVASPAQYKQIEGSITKDVGNQVKTGGSENTVTLHTPEHFRFQKDVSLIQWESTFQQL